MSTHVTPDEEFDWTLDVKIRIGIYRIGVKQGSDADGKPVFDARVLHKSNSGWREAFSNATAHNAEAAISICLDWLFQRNGWRYPTILSRGGRLHGSDESEPIVIATAPVS